MANNLTLDFKARKDRDGMIFYVAKLKGPFSIDCEKGVVFLAFVSDQGGERLQIAPMDNDKDMDE
jgi:hypothetical protein